MVCDAVKLARDLENAPPNELYPETLAEAARISGAKHGYRVTVWDEKRIRQNGFGGLLAVSAGSSRPPRFVIMEMNAARHGSRDDRPRREGRDLRRGRHLDQTRRRDGGHEDGHVGRGGGHRHDGSGEQARRYRSTWWAWCPRRKTSSAAPRCAPGTSSPTTDGTTSEVDNTDAEGRLILADALAYAPTYKPAAVIDLATLTGACVVALGVHATGMMGNDEVLMAELKAAGEKTFERVWPLPLFEEYETQIKSDVADVKNVGGRWAGAITAGLFLKRFIGNHPWVHLDIAGTAMLEESIAVCAEGRFGRRGPPPGGIPENPQRVRGVSADRTLRPPVVGLTAGDPNGIGPEVVLRALLDPRVRRVCRPLLVGDAGVFAYYLRKFRIPLTLLPVPEPPLSWGRDIVPVIGPPGRTRSRPGRERRHAPAGFLAGTSLEHAAALWKRGMIDGIVTGPLAKDTFNAAGFRYPGQTEMLAKAAGSHDALMLMLSGRLRIALATIHMPLRRVARRPDGERLARVFRLFTASLRADFGFRRPRIAVLGLNPHAGEGGLLGTEERDVIIPAIRAARRGARRHFRAVPRGRLLRERFVRTVRRHTRDVPRPGAHSVEDGRICRGGEFYRGPSPGEDLTRPRHSL